MGSGMNLDQLGNSGKDPSSVCQKREYSNVAMQSSVVLNVQAMRLFEALRT